MEAFSNCRRADSLNGARESPPVSLLPAQLGFPDDSRIRMAHRPPSYDACAPCHRNYSLDRLSEYVFRFWFDLQPQLDVHHGCCLNAAMDGVP